MYGDLSIDPSFNVYYGIINPEWFFEDDEEEAVPEWKLSIKKRRKPLVIHVSKTPGISRRGS